MGNLSNNAFKSTLVPLDGLDLGDFVWESDLGLGSAAFGDTFTWSSPENVSLERLR